MGCRGGVQIIRAQGLRSPHPYPSPEVGGKWLRQKTGRRVTGFYVGHIRCLLQDYCQNRSAKRKRKRSSPSPFGRIRRSAPTTSYIFVREYSCSDAGIPKPFPAFSAVFESSVCQSQHTKPPVFVNESIGFVQRFH